MPWAVEASRHALQLRNCLSRKQVARERCSEMGTQCCWEAAANRHSPQLPRLPEEEIELHSTRNRCRQVQLPSPVPAVLAPMSHKRLQRFQIIANRLVTENLQKRMPCGR